MEIILEYCDNINETKAVYVYYWLFKYYHLEGEKRLLTRYVNRGFTTSILMNFVIRMMIRTKKKDMSVTWCVFGRSYLNGYNVENYSAVLNMKLSCRNDVRSNA